MSTPSTTRVAFMGTPEFALPSLKALLNAGYDVVACYSQPPKPMGRGHQVQEMPIHAFAKSKGIPVFTPKSLKSKDEQERFSSLNLDIAVVVAYGLILPKDILDIPKYGCVNVHGSLLPRWRGAAPLHRALLAGDKKTGISIMQMDEGLDTGPVILTEEFPIVESMTAQDLHDQMALLGGKALVSALPGYLDGSLIPEPQSEEGATYASKLEREEGLLVWTEPASMLLRKIKALNPWPGVWFEHLGHRIKVIDAVIDTQSGPPGTILDNQLTIACADHSLRPTRVQKAGKSPMKTEELLRGYELPQGTQL